MRLRRNGWLFIASMASASASASLAAASTAAVATGSSGAVPVENLGPVFRDEPADVASGTNGQAAEPVSGQDQGGPARSWLRPARETRSKSEETSSGFPTSLLAMVLLGGLAGAAVVMKFRRNSPAPWSPPSGVRVLSTTKIGPKASLVTAEVHGRVLLLGVTEQSVSELGWIEDASGETTYASDDESEEPRPAPARGTFGQVFGNVFKAAERPPKEPEFRGNPNVAALIAARETRDVVSTSYSRSSAGVERRSTVARAPQPEPRVETQVAGLVRRRR
jgi:flagellar biogenesis protein FliO